jgi:hypothetical protein
MRRRSSKGVCHFLDIRINSSLRNAVVIIILFCMRPIMMNPVRFRVFHIQLGSRVLRAMNCSKARVYFLIVELWNNSVAFNLEVGSITSIK